MHGCTTAITTATGMEWQLATATGMALNRVAALTAALQEGRWEAAHHTIAELGEALSCLDEVLSAGLTASQAPQAGPTAERLVALLVAAGHPLALIGILFDQGSVEGLYARVQEQVRADLRGFALTASGRDDLLRRAGRVGLSESETARLAQVSRTTVRVAAGKVVAQGQQA